jgi:hypothetical protein
MPFLIFNKNIGNFYVMSQISIIFWTIYILIHFHGLYLARLLETKELRNEETRKRGNTKP